MHSKYLLDPEKFFVLAEALGDTLETVIAVDRLRRGLCRAYVVGVVEEL